MPFVNAEKQRSYQARWQAKRRQEWLAANGPCRDCGSWDDLQVDHKDPSQKVTHRVWSWSKARREAELAKCEPRCRSCHAKKTARENSRPLVHGTHTGYAYRGCRCAECTEAQRVYCLTYRSGRAA